MPQTFQKTLGLLGSLFLIVLVIFFVILALNEVKRGAYIGIQPEAPKTISFSGEGKVSVKPDLAIVNFGVETQATTVKAAQTENTRVYNAIRTVLERENVAEKDIQTASYSIRPRYEYDENARRQRIDGFIVVANYTVKVRNLDNLGDLMQGVGDQGANTVTFGGFTVDEPDKAKAEARAEAIGKAKERAQELASQLGLKLGAIVAYNEGGIYEPMYRGMMMEALSVPAKAPAPTIEPGENEILANVTLTYELLK